MGLDHLQPYFLAAQFVLQALLLMLLLTAIGRRAEEGRIGHRLLKAVGISLATVLLEAWLLRRIGWMVLIPAVALPVLVFMNASWSAMWSSCVAVLLFSASSALLTLDFGEMSRERLEARRLDQRRRKKVRVARYQQVAGEIDEIAEAGQEKPTPEPAPPPLAPEPPPPPAGTPPAPAEPPPAEETVPPQPAPAEPSAPGPPPRSEADWHAARAMVSYRGQVARGGRRLAHINGRIYEEYDLLSVILEGVVYRWLIVGIRQFKVDLQRLDARGAD